jgi:hypothetical protein
LGVQSVNINRQLLLDDNCRHPASTDVISLSSILKSTWEKQKNPGRGSALDYVSDEIKLLVGSVRRDSWEVLGELADRCWPIERVQQP